MGCNHFVNFAYSATLIDPAIQGGSSTGQAINTPSFSGPATGDPVFWQSVAQGAGPFIPPGPLDADAVAAVFKDTLGNPLAPGANLVMAQEMAAALAPTKLAEIFRDCTGTNLQPNQRVATCEDLDNSEVQIQTNLTAYIDSKVDPAVILANLKSGGGLPLIPGTKVPTWDEFLANLAAATTPAAIAAVFETSTGVPMSPGTRLMNAAEIQAAIELAVCLGCGGGGGGSGRSIKSVTWNGTKTTLTITDTDGTTDIEWPVDFTAFAKAFALAGSTPATADDSWLPTTIFGNRTALLGNPNAFAQVTISGTNYAVPLYTL